MFRPKSEWPMSEHSTLYMSKQEITVPLLNVISGAIDNWHYPGKWMHPFDIHVTFQSHDIRSKYNKNIKENLKTFSRWLRSYFN